MKIRRILSAIFGVIQSSIGVVSAVLTVLLFFNIFEIQMEFNMIPELLPLYLLTLGLFSVFSVISGFFLIREWRGIT